MGTAIPCRYLTIASTAAAAALIRSRPLVGEERVQEPCERFALHVVAAGDCVSVRVVVVIDGDHRGVEQTPVTPDRDIAIAGQESFADALVKRVDVVAYRRGLIVIVVVPVTPAAPAPPLFTQLADRVG